MHKQKRKNRAITFILIAIIVSIVIYLFVILRQNGILHFQITSINNQIDELNKSNGRSLNEKDTLISSQLNQIVELKSLIENLTTELNLLKYPTKALPLSHNELMPLSLLSLEELGQAKAFFPFEVSLSLIYKASYHGDSEVQFHKLCDSYSSLLFVLTIASTESKIGGYTSVGFSHNNTGLSQIKHDDKAFLFSLSLNKKYPVKNPTASIVVNKGMLFSYNTDLMIYDNCLSNMKSYSGFPKHYNNEEGNSSRYELTEGKNNFKLKELELFHVAYDK